jgi:hypothetical protein
MAPMDSNTNKGSDMNTTSADSFVREARAANRQVVRLRRLGWHDLVAGAAARRDRYMQRARGAQ